MQDNTTEDVNEELSSSTPCNEIGAPSNVANITINVSEKDSEIQLDSVQSTTQDVVCSDSQDIFDAHLEGGVNVTSKQKTLDDELLMEEELLKGEDDDAYGNLNTEDLILDEDSVVMSDSSQIPKTQTSNISHQNADEENGADLEINIDSLLATPNQLPDNNLEINETELLDEITYDIQPENDMNSVNNPLIYDEDSLLKELNTDTQQNEVELDKNIDSFDDNEDILLADNMTPTQKEVDSEMDENALLEDTEDTTQMVVDRKDTPMDETESIVAVDDTVTMGDDDSSKMADEEISLPIDSQMSDESKTMPMEANYRDTEQNTDAVMEENTLLMDEDNTVGVEENIDTPMEENILLNDDDNMEENNIAENSQITIDENILLEEDSRDNLNPISDAITINENALLSDNEPLSPAADGALAEADVSNNEGVDEVDTGASKVDLDGRLISDEIEDETESNINNEIQTESENGLGIKINLITSGSVDTEVFRTCDEGDEIQDDVVASSGDGVINSSSESVLNDVSHLMIEECGQLTMDDQGVGNSDSENYTATEPGDSNQIESDFSEITVEPTRLQVNMPANNELFDKETEFNEIENVDIEKTLVKEELLENEFEEDYLAKVDGEFENEQEDQDNYEDDPDYGLGNTMVKEEMADIESMVDVKQELEESDHLAFDHNIKQEYLDPDGIKEEYLGDDMPDSYYNNEKLLPEVVPIALRKSSDFCDIIKLGKEDDMVVPASMISVADIKNMNSKESEEIIISDKCLDVANFNKIGMDIENEMDSLLAPQSFACTICHRKYQNVVSLQRHEKVHEIDENPTTIEKEEEVPVESAPLPNFTPIESGYNCSCGKGFKRKSSVLACMRTHRLKGIWCDECGISLRNRRELKSHMLRQHTKRKKPKCTVCNKEFASRKSFLRHARLRYDSHLIYAHLWKDNPALEGNVADVENMAGFNCKLCNLDFETELGLSEHNSTAHPPVPVANTGKEQVEINKPQQPSLKFKFKCKTCKKVFPTLGTLTLHKANHSKKTSKLKYKCERCFESFQTRSELSSHRRLHCRGVLNDYSKLQYAVEKERLPKQVKCEVCAQTYNSKEEMEIHRDTTHPFVTFSKEDATETRIFFK